MKFINRPLSGLRISFIVVVCSLALLLLCAAMTAPAASLAAETKKPEKVTFNFVDVDITAVTKFISEITGKNFIFDEKVKGKITIIAPTKLSIDDAYTLFTSVLELKGLTVVPSGLDAYKIVPSIEAKQRGLHISTDGMPLDESYIARLISFQYISAEDALKFLQPLVSKDGYISIFGPGNLLLAVDSGLNIEKILSLIDHIDKPSSAEIPEVIRLKNASAETIAKLLNEGFAKGKAGKGPGQQVPMDGAMAVADQRLNAIILFGDQSVRESIKLLISIIDTPSPETMGRINVYFLENADATELAKVLEVMIKGQQSARQTPAAAPGAQVSPFEAAGGISITPDKATNSLLIVASPADYQNLTQILKQLDKRRKQVFVEAMIIEASIDKLNELGTKWRAAVTHNGEPVAIGGVGAFDQSTLQSIITGLAGMSIGGMGNFFNVPITTVDPITGEVTSSSLKVPGFAALFSLNEFKGAVNVLSTPQLLTSDNKEAEIIVGENVPFISQSQTSTTSGVAIPGVINSIVRQDVGIKLTITPQITEGDYVKLDIYQEISSVKQDSTAILISIGPTTTKRSTKTSVVVKDDQTVVIGGLIQEREEENITKIPLLGDMPLLGYLFKQTSVSKTKTNLLVFLTPHIIKEAESLARITGEKQKEMAVARNQYAEGELLIKFKEGVTEDKALSIISQKGASVIKFDGKMNLYNIRLRNAQLVEEALKDFMSFPEVLYTEPNYTFKIR
jgi:general secretion pathway protein D